MNDITSLVIFICALALSLGVIFIIILIIRWVFRIDEIIDYLKRIADKLDPPQKQVISKNPSKKAKG